LLGTDSIAPGQTGYVELILDEPVCALWGDRYIVRDQSARHTLGGGFVVNPFAAPRGRTRPQRKAAAEALAIADPARALAALLESSAPDVDLAHFAIGRDLGTEDAERIFSASGMRVFQAGGARFGVPAARWSALRAEALAALAELHRNLPDHLGCKESTLTTLMKSRPSAALFRAVVSELVAQAQVARTGPWLYLPAHRPVPNPADLTAWRQIERLIEREGLRAPSLSALAEALKQDTVEVLKTLHRLETLGFVIGVAKNRFFTLRQAAKLAGIAERLAASVSEDGSALTAAVFREESGIGRNLTIEVLEYFDRAGLTRRKGAQRQMLRKSSELFGDPSS